MALYKTSDDKISWTMIAADAAILLGLCLEVFGSSLPPAAISIAGIIFRFLRYKTNAPMTAKEPTKETPNVDTKEA